jgi:ABC-2 type transport system ATP-binding protein
VTTPVLECAAVRKVFETYERAPGLRGVLKNFFARETLEITALDGVDLRVEAGELLGLIGPNGAGKTTLVKALTGIVPISSGRATLFGADAFHLTDAHKQRLSLVMGQRSQLWWDLPPLDSFRLLKEIYEVEGATFERRVTSYARLLGVEGQLGMQLRQLSLGQRMKMELIGAFLHDPQIVFLDEPTIGLDLVSRETIRRFLLDLNERRGVTMVFTSHDMEDIEATCRRLVLLESGRVLFDGDLVELQRRVSGRRAVEVHLEPGSRWAPEHAAELAQFHAELALSTAGSLTFLVPAERARDLIRRLFELLDVRDLSVERQPLEHLIREVYRTGSIEPAP